MESARALYERVRRDLSELERQIMAHPLVVEAGRGELGIEAVKRFATNQWYIVSELRSQVPRAHYVKIRRRGGA